MTPKLERFASPFRVLPASSGTGKRSDVNGMAISGVASVYDSIVDSEAGPTIVKRGAFTATLRNSAGFPLLWQHNASEPIGKVFAVESSRGLEISARLSNIQKARDILTLLQDAVIDGLSIGFFTIQSNKGKDQFGNLVRMVTELDLQEISIVTFPADPLARIGDAKELPDAELAAMQKIVDGYAVEQELEFLSKQAVALDLGLDEESWPKN